MRSKAGSSGHVVHDPAAVYPAWRLWVLDKMAKVLGVPIWFIQWFRAGATPVTEVNVHLRRAFEDPYTSTDFFVKGAKQYAENLWHFELIPSPETSSSGNSATFDVDMSNEGGAEEDED